MERRRASTATPLANRERRRTGKKYGVLQAERGFTQPTLAPSSRTDRDQSPVSRRTWRSPQSAPSPTTAVGAGPPRPIAHGRPVSAARPAILQGRKSSVSRTTPASRMAPSRDRLDDPASGGPPPGRRPRSGRRRAQATGLLIGVTTAVGLVAPGLAGATVTAPRDIISFPARDFVSATGYDLTKLYTVEVQHPDGRVVGTVTDIAPKDDGEGGGLGIIEVNHPGGACWVGQTPDIRPCDTVRIRSQEANPTVDESTVRNVAAARPVQTAIDTIQVHGTAQTAAGSALPEAELEQRLV